MPANAPQTSNSQKEYVKLANAPGLYRHVRTGHYLGVKKINGKHREHSLGTSDRKIADRRFTEWVEHKLLCSSIVRWCRSFERLTDQQTGRPRYKSNAESHPDKAGGPIE